MDPWGNFINPMMVGPFQQSPSGPNQAQNYTNSLNPVPVPVTIAPNLQFQGQFTQFHPSSQGAPQMPFHSVDHLSTPPGFPVPISQAQMQNYQLAQQQLPPQMQQSQAVHPIQQSCPILTPSMHQAMNQGMVHSQPIHQVVQQPTASQQPMQQMQTMHLHSVRQQSLPQDPVQVVPSQVCVQQHAVHVSTSSPPQTILQQVQPPGQEPSDVQAIQMQMQQETTPVKKFRREPLDYQPQLQERSPVKPTEITPSPVKLQLKRQEPNEDLRTPAKEDKTNEESREKQSVFSEEQLRVIQQQIKSETKGSKCTETDTGTEANKKQDQKQDETSEEEVQEEENATEELEVEKIEESVKKTPVKRKGKVNVSPPSAIKKKKSSAKGVKFASPVATVHTLRNEESAGQKNYGLRPRRLIPPPASQALDDDSEDDSVTLQKDPDTGEFFVHLAPEEYHQMKLKLKLAMGGEEIPTTQPERLLFQRRMAQRRHWEKYKHDPGFLQRNRERVQKCRDNKKGRRDDDQSTAENENNGAKKSLKKAGDNSKKSVPKAKGKATAKTSGPDHEEDATERIRQRRRKTLDKFRQKLIEENKENSPEVLLGKKRLKRLQGTESDEKYKIRQAAFRVRQLVHNNESLLVKVLLHVARRLKSRNQMLVKEAVEGKCEVALAMCKEINKKLRCIQSFRRQNRIVEQQKLVAALREDFGPLRDISEWSGANVEYIHRVFSVPKGESVHKATQRFEAKKKEVHKFLDQETISYSLPGKRFANKKFLKDTWENVCKKYEEQEEYHTKGKVAANTLKSKPYRPKNLLMMGKAPLLQCLCTPCTNFDAIRMALVNAGVQGITANKYNSVLSTLCATRERQLPSSHKFPLMKCLSRECEDCSLQKLKDSLIARNQQAYDEKKIVSWWEWKKEDSKSVRVLKKAPLSTSLNIYIQHLEIMPYHLFKADWTRNCLEILKTERREGHVIQVTDFSMNYTIKFQNETQDHFWTGTQVTIVGTVSYYRCPQAACNELVTDCLLHISEDMKHDSFVARGAMHQAMKYLLEKNIPIEKLFICSDNCAAQFKSRRIFVEMAKMMIEVIRIYFESSHGKSRCDSLFGSVKSWMDRRIKSGQFVIRNAKDFLKVCQEHYKTEHEGTGECDHKIINFKYLGASDIKRKVDADLQKAVPGTLEFHSVKNTQRPLELKTREIPCVCNACLTDEGECLNKNYADVWDLKKLIPKKGSNKRKYEKRAFPLPRGSTASLVTDNGEEQNESDPESNNAANAQVTTNATEDDPYEEPVLFIPDSTDVIETEVVDMTNESVQHFVEESEDMQENFFDQGEVVQNADIVCAPQPSTAAIQETEEHNNASYRDECSTDIGHARTESTSIGVTDMRIDEQYNDSYPCTVTDSPQDQNDIVLLDVTNLAVNEGKKQGTSNRILRSSRRREQNQRSEWEVTLNLFASCTNIEELKLAVDQYQTSRHTPLPVCTFPTLETLHHFEVDYNAMNDLPSDAPADVTPVQIMADGNCFVRSASFCCFGSEEHHAHLRLLMVIEGIKNKKIYLDDGYLRRGASFTHQRATLPVIFAQYSEQYRPGMKLNSEGISQLYDAELMALCKNSTYMGIWQFFQLANVLRVPVRGVYPERGFSDIRKDFNRKFFPIDVTDTDCAELQCINIMWTSLNGRSSVNHFVALIHNNYNQLTRNAQAEEQAQSMNKEQISDESDSVLEVKRASRGPGRPKKSNPRNSKKSEDNKTAIKETRYGRISKPPTETSFTVDVKGLLNLNKKNNKSSQKTECTPPEQQADDVMLHDIDQLMEQMPSLISAQKKEEQQVPVQLIPEPNAVNQEVPPSMQATEATTVPLPITIHNQPSVIQLQPETTFVNAPQVQGQVMMPSGVTQNHIPSMGIPMMSNNNMAFQQPNVNMMNWLFNMFAQGNNQMPMQFPQQQAMQRPPTEQILNLSTTNTGFQVGQVVPNIPVITITNNEVVDLSMPFADSSNATAEINQVNDAANEQPTASVVTVTNELPPADQVVITQVDVHVDAQEESHLPSASNMNEDDKKENSTAEEVKDGSSHASDTNAASVESESTNGKNNPVAKETVRERDDVVTSTVPKESNAEVTQQPDVDVEKIHDAAGKSEGESEDKKPDVASVKMANMEKTEGKVTLKLSVNNASAINLQDGNDTGYMADNENTMFDDEENVNKKIATDNSVKKIIQRLECEDEAGQDETVGSGKDEAENSKIDASGKNEVDRGSTGEEESVQGQSEASLIHENENKTLQDSCATLSTSVTSTCVGKPLAASTPKKAIRPISPIVTDRHEENPISPENDAIFREMATENSPSQVPASNSGQEVSEQYIATENTAHPQDVQKKVIEAAAKPDDVKKMPEEVAQTAANVEEEADTEQEIISDTDQESNRNEEKNLNTTVIDIELSRKHIPPKKFYAQLKEFAKKGLNKRKESSEPLRSNRVPKFVAPKLWNADGRKMKRRKKIF